MLSIKDCEILARSFIFCEESPEGIRKFYDSGFCMLKEFSKGDIIFGDEKSTSQLGIMLSGKALAVCEHKACLKSFAEGDIFGAAGVFCEKAAEPFSKIEAATRCRALYISREGVERFLTENPKRAVMYIRFLSDRVAFLNRRISTFSKNEGIERLSEYIYNNADEKGRLSEINFAKLSRELAISRASLYRAKNTLTGEKIIEIDGKEIKILDINRLKGVF